jgi:hypothetical protein
MRVTEHDIQTSAAIFDSLIIIFTDSHPALTHGALRCRRLRRLRIINRVRKIKMEDEERILELYFKANAEYEIWSPYDAFEAADILLELLEKEKQNERRTSETN